MRLKIKNSTIYSLISDFAINALLLPQSKGHIKRYSVITLLPPSILNTSYTGLNVRVSSVVSVTLFYHLRNVYFPHIHKQYGFDSKEQINFAKSLGYDSCSAFWEDFKKFGNYKLVVWDAVPVHLQNDGQVSLLP